MALPWPPWIHGPVAEARTRCLLSVVAGKGEAGCWEEPSEVRLGPKQSGCSLCVRGVSLGREGECGQHATELGWVPLPGKKVCLRVLGPA